MLRNVSSSVAAPVDPSSIPEFHLQFLFSTIDHLCNNTSATLYISVDQEMEEINSKIDGFGNVDLDVPISSNSNADKSEANMYI